MGIKFKLAENRNEKKAWKLISKVLVNMESLMKELKELREEGSRKQVPLTVIGTLEARISKMHDDIIEASDNINWKSK